MLFLEIGWPRKARDAYVADLWEEYGLGKNPSTLQIYPVAAMLLSKPGVHSKLEGMSIFLGRQVDLSDPLCSYLYKSPEDILEAIKSLPEFFTRRKFYQAVPMNLAVDMVFR